MRILLTLQNLKYGRYLTPTIFTHTYSTIRCDYVQCTRSTYTVCSALRNGTAQSGLMIEHEDVNIYFTMYMNEVIRYIDRCIKKLL